MAIEAELGSGKVGSGKSAVEVRPLAHLRATSEELERLRAIAPPLFDIESWRRDAVPSTPEELADLDDFLREREAMRQRELARLEERLVELGE